jgi:hypothetical protein
LNTPFRHGALPRQVDDARDAAHKQYSSSSKFPCRLMVFYKICYLLRR